MFRLKKTQHISATNYATHHLQTFINQLDFKFDVLVTGAAVFRTINDIPYLLILKRSQTDSLPGLWELPGGEKTLVAAHAGVGKLYRY